MHNQLPVPVRHPGIDLPDPALPVIIVALLVAPQGVDIHHRQRSIAFPRHLDPSDRAPVVDQPVLAEQLLPSSFPALAVVAPEHKYPSRGIVVVRRRRPRPHHVGMKNVNQRLGVLPVPGARLAIHYLLDLWCDIFHMASSELREEQCCRRRRCSQFGNSAIRQF
jgi:hypothetical protein